jgi:hypothetical protein
MLKGLWKMYPLDTDVNDRPWGVRVDRVWRLGELWICHCLPEYTDGFTPRFPGFDVLKIWLNMHCPSVAYEVLYNNGMPLLQVTFNDPGEAILFRLNV